MRLAIFLFFSSKTLFSYCFEIRVKDSNLLCKIIDNNKKHLELFNKYEKSVAKDREYLEYLDVFFETELDELFIEFIYNQENEIIITYNFINYDSKLYDTFTTLISLLNDLFHFDQFYIPKLIMRFNNLEQFFIDKKVSIKIIECKIENNHRFKNKNDYISFKNKFVIFFFCLQKIHGSIIQNNKNLAGKDYFLKINKYIQTSNFYNLLYRDIELELNQIELKNESK